MGEVEVWRVQECHKERKMVKIRAQNSILFVHSPRSASASGLLLNSDHATAPELSITSNNDTPVVHDDHAVGKRGRRYRHPADRRGDPEHYRHYKQ